MTTLAATDLGSFGRLTDALGITTASGGTNAAWFTDPVGGSTANPHGLKTVLADDGQRTALVEFVDEVLGPPEASTEDATTWLPLFRSADPELTVYAVLTPVVGAVHLGVGVAHSTGDAGPRVTTRVHAPLFRVPRGTAALPSPSSGLPSWLLLGGADGRVAIEVDATFTDDPPAPGEAFLRGLRAGIEVPTDGVSDVGFGLTLRDLQLPGATSPTSPTLDVDGLDGLGKDVFDFAVGLLRTQLAALDESDPGLRVAAALGGLLGLREVADLPAFPFAELPGRGIAAVTDWVADVLADDDARDAWLSQLALLTGGTARPAEDAVAFSLGPADLVLGLRVTPGTAGHLVLVPWLRLDLEASPGAVVALSADLLRADTASGTVTALPALDLAAVFGTESGARLLNSGPVRIGSLRVGIGIDAQRHPALRLTLHDVELGADTTSPSHHELLDLSSPEAALAAVDDVVADLLTDLLDGLGDAGALIAAALGVDPPAGIDPVSVPTLLADPLGSLAAYWGDVLGDGAAAVEVLGRLAELITGTATAVTGTGTTADPWLLPLHDTAPVALAVTVVDDRVRLALTAAPTHTLTGTGAGDVAIGVAVRVVLVELDLAARAASFLTEVGAGLRLDPAGPGPLRLPLLLAEVSARGVGLDVTWSPGAGVLLTPVGALSLEWSEAGSRHVIDLPLPTRSPDGGLVLAADWTDVELALGRLLLVPELTAVHPFVELLGWNGSGPRLALADLVADPGAALREWAADLALECDHLHATLAAVATVLSAGGTRAPFGLGSRGAPYRMPVGGHPGLPGPAVWSDPPCPRPPEWGEAVGFDPGPGPDGAALVAALEGTAGTLPEIADLLMARPSLGAGLDALVTRCTGTDGLVGATATLPSGVTSAVLTGYGFEEARAASVLGPLPFLGMPSAPAARVHVTTDRDWWLGQDPAARVDATGPAAAVAALAPTDAGPWFVLVPTVSSADAGADGVAAQADRIEAVLRERTTPVTVVAHGGPGAAALRAAARPALGSTIGAVVTVGSPWTAVPVATFVGHGGSALSFLTAIAGTDVPHLPDDQLARYSDALQRSFGLLRRMRQERTVADLPSAAAEPIRPGLVVHAVLGSLTHDDATAQLTALIGYAVTTRLEAAQGGTGGPDETDLESTRELHVGVGLPAHDVALGALSLGVSADLSLLSVHRDAPRLRTEQVLTTALRLGVSDGWLVGGPGASQRDLEVRWLEVVLGVPLDGGDATCELVLHEARAFTAYRERWVVRADDLDPTATLALPEVKLLLGAVAERISVEASGLADLLTAYGLFRDGGLDPAGLDRLLFDTRAFLRDPLAAAPGTVVALLRDLLDASEVPGPTVLRLGEDTAHVDIDLAAGTVTGAASLTAPGMASVAASLTVGGGTAQAQVSLGEIVDGGGLRLRLDLDPAGPAVAVDVGGPTSHRGIPLYPLTVDDLLDLLRLLSPALVVDAVLEGLRGALSTTARAALDAVLTQLDLLDPVLERARIPVGFLLDPVGHLRRRPDPLAAVVAVLDGVADLVWPDRTDPGWPVTADVRISYAVLAGRLDLLAHVDLDATVDTAAVTLALEGGLSIAPVGPSRALLTASVDVDGYGLALRVGATPAVPVSLDLLRPAPAAPIAIHPSGPGLAAGAEIAGAAAEAAVVVALDELISRRGSGTSTVQRVGTVADEVALGLGLVADPTGADHSLDPGQVSAFAADPGARLLARLPALATQGIASIATALGSTEITATTTGSRTRLAYAGGGSADAAFVELDGATQEVVLGGRVEVAGVGVLSVDEIRIGSAGVRVTVTAGPLVLDVGSVRLFPVVSVLAGVGGGAGFERRLGIGLATSAAGSESVELRWALDATPPELVAVTAGAPGTDPATIAARTLGLALGIASGVLAERLATVLTTEVVDRLQDVVFTGGTASIDPGFVTSLLDPAALLQRLHTLVWNCAAVGTPVSVTIEDVLEVALTSVPSSGGRHLGLRVSLPDGERITLAEGALTVALEVESSWIVADVDPGLSILVLEGTSAATLQLRPGVVAAGLGVRFTSSGAPLIDLDGFSVDGIAVRIYGEASAGGVGGGAQLVLDGLSVAPGGGGGSNPVANGIMNDVGAASGSARPTFSPALAVQKPPARGLSVSLRAGDPPGPWWIVIQRQLGPLYVDRIGFDAVESESGGVTRVSRISLLFTGQLDLFGLTAAVDSLSLSWNGGDVLSIGSWSVDLMGLAVSADMAGVSLSGGLLKVVEGSATSYVGMLVGRFAAYGLSVFGGFTQDGADASFFVFGGFNGPIGGPPAFFLTGIAGGLGINRGLRVPDDLSDFGSYPFIAALNPAATPKEPMEALRELSHYFPHQVGNFWFAGGISFTSFSLVDGVAVLAVSFGSAGLDITLFGLARMALPRPGAALVSIELALVVRFSMSEGVFMIRAQLTDNSWLLYPEIRLTGGFAFAIWWKGPLAGQFVLTMGGYHPSFHVEGYPDVPRLGLVWRISDSLVIKGGSYFALTSEALMAGQSVEASLDLGWVWAKVTFGADGIVYFDPFSFDVTAYARISAGIHIDLWLTTISLSITIGARIHVWGPDFAGEVTFEIGPASVPIRFGSRRTVAPETLAWPAFVTKYLEEGSGGAARALTSITGRGTLPTSTKGATGAPSADGSASLPHRVFAEFEITVTTSIPARTVEVGPTSRTLEPTLAGATSSLGLAPMGLRSLTPTLRIALERLSPAGRWESHDAALTPLAAGLAAGSDGPAHLATTAFPLGVFGAPNDSATANTSLPSHEVVVAASQVTLVAGIVPTDPGPLMDYYRVEAKRRPLPLQATRTTRAVMVNLGATLTVPVAATSQAALAQAADLLFEHGREPHSALARASFATGRAAPPMFGTLTDGLVADNGARGGGDRLPFVREAARRPRRPVVVGFLEAGDGAARRAPTTTVADGRLKRRPAPSLDSARSRLSRRLPVALDLATPVVAPAAGTLAATAAAPRTAAASTGSALHGGRLSGAGLQGLVSGLGAGAGLVPRTDRARRLSRAQRARADELGRSIRGGDVVVLQSLDARYDGDEGHRPHLGVTGAARVLALTGRAVVTDVETVAGRGEQRVTVPPGTTHLVLHAGGDLDLETGCPGWHDGSRIARVGERVGLGAGCTLSVERAATAAERTVAWQPAHALTAGASEVLTRFSRPVRTVAIALAGTDDAPVDPDLALTATSLVLSGAALAGADGGDRPPVLVVLGSLSVLVYAVVPDEDAPAVSVTVRNGPTWGVTGVVGSTEPVEAVADRIAEAGLPGVLSRVTAADGEVTVAWIDARRTR